MPGLSASRGIGTALVSPRDGPHPLWVVQSAGAHGLLDFKGLDVVVVKEVIEALAVNAVCVIAKVLGVRRRIHLVKISRPSRSITDAGPNIASNILDIGLLHQQDRSSGIAHDRSLVAFRIPVRETSHSTTSPVDAHPVPSRCIQIWQMVAPGCDGHLIVSPPVRADTVHGIRSAQSVIDPAPLWIALQGWNAVSGAFQDFGGQLLGSKGIH